MSPLHLLSRTIINNFVLISRSYSSYKKLIRGTGIWNIHVYLSEHFWEKEYFQAHWDEFRMQSMSHRFWMVEDVKLF